MFDMNDKIKNIISMILNIIIIISTVYAISTFFTGKVTEGNMQVTGFAFLRFFTNLSNIFVSLASLIMLVFNIKNIKSGTNEFPERVMTVKFIATVSVTVTFVTVVIFLAPLFASMGLGYLTLFKGSMFFLHFTTPIIAIISVLFFERCGNLAKKNAVLGLIPVFLYSIVYIVMVVFIGAENGGWNDFYGFTFGGKMQLVPVSLAAMYGLTLALSFAEWKIYSLVNSKNKKSNI